MQQIICDCCGKSMILGSRRSSFQKFSYLVHLDAIASGAGNACGYVDCATNEPISGRDEAWDVCIHCYNRIMMESVKKFHDLRDKNQAKNQTPKRLEEYSLTASD